MDSAGSQRNRIRDGLALLLLTAGLVAISLPREVPPSPVGAPPAGGAAPEPAAGGVASTPGGTSPPPGPSSEYGERRSKLSVRVDFRDALTGLEVPGVRWSEHDPRWGAEASPPPRDARSHAGGDTAELSFPFPRIDVAPPEGYVCLPPRTIPSRPIQRARTGVLTVHLHPEAGVLVEYGTYVFSGLVANVTEARAAGTKTPVRVSRQASGVQVLRGIPFMPREEVVLRVEWNGGVAGRGAWCGTAATAGEGRRYPDLEWVARMGDSSAELLVFELMAPGRTRPASLEEVDPMEGLPPGEPEWTPPGSGPVDMSVHGPVRLELLDRSGRPASGVRVAVRSVNGRTGKDGRVTLPGVVGGDHAVRVLDEGFSFPRARVSVLSEEGADLVVRELVGGELEVRVLDRDLEPVPRATLGILREDGRTWWDVDDAGVQRLDPYVGADGRRVLTHVPPGTLHVRAKVGTREGQARVEIVDGARQVVTITLPSLASR